MENPNNNQPRNRAGKIITWNAPEYAEAKKNPLWFVALAVVMGVVVLYGINAGSWSMVTVFILITLLMLYFGAQKPRTISVRLDATGVSVNNILYEYKVIRKFWMVYYPPEVKVLYLETGAYLNNLVRIELGKQDPVAVKNFLLQYLEEDLDGKESMVDILARKLRF